MEFGDDQYYGMVVAQFLNMLTKFDSAPFFLLSLSQISSTNVAKFYGYGIYGILKPLLMKYIDEAR